MGLSKCLKVFLLLNVFYQSNALSPLMVNLSSIPLVSKVAKSTSESLSNIPTINIPEIPEVADFNTDLIKSRAEKFYKTLPKTILDDADLAVPELIRKYGYPCEEHKVTTTDGYVLTIHRIPRGKNGVMKNKPVVYLQHGILSSSADWLVPGPEKGLGYILADAGYDVWMPNVRGTRYSRKHISLNPDSKEFWDFSWHEIALNDVPTMIDYALNEAKQKDLFYIGHSQGTTVFFVMCSEKPEYNKKIKAQISLAPIGYMSRMTSPLLHVIALGQRAVGTILKITGVNEFLPNTRFLARVGKLLCSDDSVTQILCTNSLFAICGFSQKQMNVTLLPIIMGHTPAGSATKQLLHYGQEINSGKFIQFDYGLSSNGKIYNMSEPPKYLMQKITAPVYLYYSKNDWLSSERDVMQLYGELGNAKEKILVEDDKFNHIDYLYGIDAPKLVYDGVLNILKRY